METACRSEQRFTALWTPMPLTSLAVAAVPWFTGALDTQADLPAAAPATAA